MFISFPLANIFILLCHRTTAPRTISKVPCQVGCFVKDDKYGAEWFKSIKAQITQKLKSHITCCSSAVQLSLHGYKGSSSIPGNPQGEQTPSPRGSASLAKSSQRPEDITFVEPVCEPGKSQAAFVSSTPPRASLLGREGQGQGRGCGQHESWITFLRLFEDFFFL